MSHSSLLKRINIFLTVDKATLESYFNPHDPSPMYRRQISHGFEQYILSSIVSIKRYSLVTFKFVCTEEEDQKFVDPLIHAIRRHFSNQKAIKEAEFRKFKKRSYKLLLLSLLMVAFCQISLLALMKRNEHLHEALGNALEVFSWVILWKPIDKLIFHWNPYLKEINVLDKVINGEVIIVEKKLAEVIIKNRLYAS
jgi:hypothetical protein